VATHAHRFGLLELPRPGRAAAPLVALALAALALESDPALRLAGAAAAGCFGVAAGVRIVRARSELRTIRRTADRLILVDAVGQDGSEIVRWRIHELVAPSTRCSLARELDQTLRRLDPARLPSASPLRRGLVRRHTELLRRLQERLLDDRPVAPRGIVLLQRLLREPGSPLYAETADRELARAISTVVTELDA
jgi:hypothetical protein